MLKATEELKNLAIYLNVDEEICEKDVLEEYIITYYLGIRLDPLIGIAGINKNRRDNIVNLLADNYFDKEISLDLMINSVYNYINKNKTCPSDILLSDNIVTLLEEYANE